MSSSSAFRLRSHRPLCFVALAAGALACSEVGTDPGPPSGSESPSVTRNGDVTGVGAPVADGRHDGRPMRIRATVGVASEVVPPPAPCLQYFETTIEGHATHLGRFEGVGSTCILGAIGPDPDPPFTAPGPGPYLTATFSNPRWELTAANGDELWLEAPDAVAVISLADNSLRAEGSHAIIGGTGRFDGATGELVSGAVNEDGMGPDDFRSAGRIRY